MANTLTFANQTLTDANIFGGINFLHDLNTGEEFSIGNTASASVSFVTDTQLPLYSKDATNGTFTWTQDSVSRGRFFITEVKKQQNKYEVTAYDAMILLDTSVTALSLTYPLSVATAASAIASYINCTISGTIYNSTMEAADGTIEDTVTIRQLLGWVAEASGCSVKIDGADQICFMYYASSGITVSASDYKEFGLEVADYTCAAIDNVTICDMAGMAAATAGSGDNSLFIQGNPFLYEATNTEAAVILGLVDSFVYAPFTCEMFEENGLEVGVMATFGSTTSLVMHIESGEGGAVASAVGSDTRAEFNKSLDIIVNEAMATANAAQQTAQQTSLHFWYTASGSEAGAHIAEVDRPTFEANPSGGNLLSTSTGIAVRDGLDELASFGASGATIGKDDGSQTHLAMDYRSIRLIDKNGIDYFHVSDLRDASGNATVTQNFTGDGSSTTFATGGVSISSVTSVTINGTATSAYTYGTASITFTTAPADGDDIKVVFVSRDATLKAYTFGMRNSYGNIGGLSVAESDNNTASGFASHAEGHLTTASKDFAHAEGQNTTASGNSSHAEGYFAVANGLASHAGGLDTVANGKCQTAIGKYNVADTDHNAFIIGNGTSSTRSNALVVTWDGNVHMGMPKYQTNNNIDKYIYDAMVTFGWDSEVLA